jgi:hypothetical protein
MEKVVGTRNWIKNPLKIHLVVFSLISVVGNAFFITASDDLFLEGVFHFENGIVYVNVIGSTLATLNLYRNYWINKRA